MKSLDEMYRDLMYARRKQNMLDFHELAWVLNTTKENMVNAQIGKPIPVEVYSRLVDWLELG